MYSCHLATRYIQTLLACSFLPFDCAPRGNNQKNAFTWNLLFISAYIYTTSILVLIFCALSHRCDSFVTWLVLLFLCCFVLFLSIFSVCCEGGEGGRDEGDEQGKRVRAVAAQGTGGRGQENGGGVCGSPRGAAAGGSRAHPGDHPRCSELVGG